MLTRPAFVLAFLSTVVLGLTACDSPERVVPIHMLPEDFTTAFPIPEDVSGGRGWSADMLAVRFAARPDAGVVHAPGLGGEVLRVVNLTTETKVAGSLRDGYYNVSDERVNTGGYYDGAAISFVPDVQLTDGWYVVVANFRGLGAELFSVGGHIEREVAYGRVHVGSRPTWHQTYLGGDGTQTFVTLFTGERVPTSSLAGTTITISADGTPVTCGPGMLPVVFFDFVCPLRPRGTRWGVRMQSDVVRSPEGASEASIEVTQTVLAEGGGGHDTALTSPRFGVDVANRVLGL